MALTNGETEVVLKRLSGIEDRVKKLNQAIVQLKQLPIKIQEITNIIDEKNKNIHLQNMFLWYAKAVIGSFTLEKRLWFLLVLTEHRPMVKRGDATKQSFARIQRKYKHKNMGDILKALNRVKALPTDLKLKIKEAILRRNYLIHHFPSDYFVDAQDPSKAAIAIAKLTDESNAFSQNIVDLNTYISKFEKL